MTQTRQALIVLIILALFVGFLVWAALPAQIEPMPL